MFSIDRYHSHIRRRDTVSLTALRLARDVFKVSFSHTRHLPIENSPTSFFSQRLVVADGECLVRAKIAEIISLLYSTACSVARWAPEAAEGLSPAAGGTTAITTLNPTYGVRQREQDWRMTYKKDGGYFVTDRRTNDPTGLIRSSQSPGGTGSGPSPRPTTAPYASSLRSTHLAGDNEDENDESTNDLNDSIDASNDIALPPPAPLQNGNGFSSMSAVPAPTSTGGPASSFAPPAPNPPPDLSFAFPDSSYDTLSFNPSLNLNSTANASSASMDPFGGLEAFDPFGLSSDGTPSLFPDGNIFNLNAWSEFASSLNLQGQGMNDGSGI